MIKKFFSVLFGADMVSSAPQLPSKSSENNVDSDALSGEDEGKSPEEMYPTSKTFKKKEARIDSGAVHIGFEYTLSESFAKNIQNFLDAEDSVSAKVVFEWYATPYQVMIVWNAKDEKTFKNSFDSASKKFDPIYDLKIQFGNKRTAIIEISTKKIGES